MTFSCDGPAPVERLSTKTRFATGRRSLLEMRSLSSWAIAYTVALGSPSWRLMLFSRLESNFADVI
jgi:hypothetical protein